MLCLEWLKFSPRSMATFSLHKVVINFKFTVYCWKRLLKRIKKKRMCHPLGWGTCCFLMWLSSLFLANWKSKYPLFKAGTFWGLGKLFQVSLKDFFYDYSHAYWVWTLVMEVPGFRGGVIQKKIAPIKLFKGLLNMLKILPCMAFKLPAKLLVWLEGCSRFQMAQVLLLGALGVEKSIWLSFSCSSWFPSGKINHF